MSDANPPTHEPLHDLPHEGPIKTPKQLILAVFFAFVVPVVAIIMLAVFVASGQKPGAGSDALSAEGVANRIQPVGMVEVKDVSDPSSLKTGEQVFQAQCSACHATGAAGAPKFGDEAAWGPRIKSGYEALLTSALKGKGNMPAQGGGDHTDFEIGRAVVYMANHAGAKFEEPKPPAAAPAQADAASAAQPAAATQVAAAAPAAPASAAAPAAAPAPAAAASPAAQGAATAGAAPALYTQTCQTCHATGVAGAPKLGDKAAWAPRLAQGIDGLTASAIKGKNAMPPRGGSAASDADIRAVVTYMVNSVK